ncbi:MAG: hypothetical protein CM1200mP41_21970 [Gammaproteobacteria bacterium]|nr:MAG: hypothetical protein CM1200mP41_21970 [Gammaproteobacteria bacterium]
MLPLTPYRHLEAVGPPGWSLQPDFLGTVFGGGPAAGEFAAHLALGQQPVVDPLLSDYNDFPMVVRLHR